MPPPWGAAGRQEAEKKKLASSAGWTPCPAVKEEDGDNLSVGPWKRPRRAPKPTFKLGSSSAAPPRRGRRSGSSTSTSPATEVPTSVAQAQAVAGPDCPHVAAAAVAAAAAVKASLPGTVRKGKRKRAAPAYLYDEAGSTGVVRNAAAATKRTPVSKTKTLTKGKGKGKGKVVPKLIKGMVKKKAAVVEPPVVSSDDEVIAASAPAEDGGGGQEMYALACAFEGGGQAIDVPAFADARGGGASGAPASADEGGGDAMEAPASAGGGGEEAMGAAGGGGGQALPVHGPQGIVLLSEVRRAIDYYNAEMNRIRQLNQYMRAIGVADWVVQADVPAGGGVGAGGGAGAGDGAEAEAEAGVGVGGDVGG